MMKIIFIFSSQENVLPANSTYFTTSECKAKLINLCSQTQSEQENVLGNLHQKKVCLYYYIIFFLKLIHFFNCILPRQSLTLFVYEEKSTWCDQTTKSLQWIVLQSKQVFWTLLIILCSALWNAACGCGCHFMPHFYTYCD